MKKLVTLLSLLTISSTVFASTNYGMAVPCKIRYGKNETIVSISDTYTVDPVTKITKVEDQNYSFTTENFQTSAEVRVTDKKTLKQTLVVLPLATEDNYIRKNGSFVNDLVIYSEGGNSVAFSCAELIPH